MEGGIKNSDELTSDVAAEKVPEDIDKNVSETGDILPEAADIIAEAAKEDEVLENTKNS